MSARTWILLAGLLWAINGTSGAAGQPEADIRALSTSFKPWTGQFEDMLQRRLIRVLAPFSRSLYYNERGHERGLSAETARDFERYLNRKYRKDLARRPVTLLLIPTTRDKLLPNLVAGLGDIAIGNLTATEERLAMVDFAAPENGLKVKELLLTGPGAPMIESLDDLAGKTVHTRPSSSYHASLIALSERLQAAGKPAIDIVAVPDALEDEDMMEMLNAGLLQAIVVDDWKAKIWAQILPDIKIHEQLVLRDAGLIGWAMRKDSPRLKAEILEFHEKKLVSKGVTPYRIQKMKRGVARLADPTGEAEWKRFEATIELFREYGGRYGFDPLMLAAQGYQESRIDQTKRSPVGAIGIMQIMPATAKELDVGDIKKAEANIHAGAKYMHRLMTRYFQDATFSGDNRTLFAFAAYNAGPGNLRKMRRLAAERGLDPDVWFNNVEIVTAEKLGLEPVTYVRNIYKYYVSYKLTVEAHERRKRARESLLSGGA
ncbi:MAG: transglycosylase SLT domain-containing protein [Chromatiaceae bacterium]|nr:transglycosylase SLT domain-containing protein [Chromatiaceae bacterium]